jgi:dihydrofolate reductase
MKLILIAALTGNRVIGKDGAVPWDIPEDMQRFKKLTLGHVVLMGRRTYETLSSPLTGRRNVVITTSRLQGVETYPTIGEALRALENEGEVYVIGGGEVFAQLLTSADELRLTIVDRETDGDTYFPPYEHLIGSLFRLASRERHDGFSFVHYVRSE